MRKLLLKLWGYLWLPVVAVVFACMVIWDMVSYKIACWTKKEGYQTDYSKYG